MIISTAGKQETGKGSAWGTTIAGGRLCRKGVQVAGRKKKIECEITASGGGGDEGGSRGDLCAKKSTSLEMQGQR